MIQQVQGVKITTKHINNNNNDNKQQKYALSFVKHLKNEKKKLQLQQQQKHKYCNKNIFINENENEKFYRATKRCTKVLQKIYINFMIIVVVDYIYNVVFVVLLLLHDGKLKAF